MRISRINSRCLRKRLKLGSWQRKSIGKLGSPRAFNLYQGSLTRTHLPLCPHLLAQGSSNSSNSVFDTALLASGSSWGPFYQVKIEGWSLLGSTWGGSGWGGRDHHTWVRFIYLFIYFFMNGNTECTSLKKRKRNVMKRIKRFYDISKKVKKKSCHLVPKVVIELLFEGRKVEGRWKYKRRERVPKVGSRGEETITELINSRIGEFHTIVVGKCCLPCGTWPIHWRWNMVANSSEQWPK